MKLTYLNTNILLIVYGINFLIIQILLFMQFKQNIFHSLSVMLGFSKYLLHIKSFVISQYLLETNRFIVITKTNKMLVHKPNQQIL